MTGSIENVYVFVADSLRWDGLPSEAHSHGAVFKTVAQSLYSPPSFATLATGLYPQQHSVTGWEKKFPDDVGTIFDLDGITGGFYQESGTEDDPIYDAVSVDGRTTIDELESPFVYMERDMTPHVPFGDYKSVEEYFTAIGDDYERLREDYQDAAAASFQKYLDRVEKIKDEFNAENTLFVYTSDHGELLGERGDVVHTFPACPELVYVPTVVTSPSLDDDLEEVADGTGIIEHVDLVETFVRLLGNSSFETAGTNILTEKRYRPWGYNYAYSERNGIDFYTADSMWWSDAGYVSHQNRRVERLLLASYMVSRSAERKALRSDLSSLFGDYFASSLEFGELPLSTQQCQTELDQFTDTIDERVSSTRDLSEDSQERLRDLGYLQ